MQLDPKLLNEDGHTDVASAKMKVDIAAKALSSYANGIEQTSQRSVG